MTKNAIGSYQLGECSASREVADRVFYLCQDGRFVEARSLLAEDASDDPEIRLASGIVAYWEASSGRGEIQTAKDILSRAARLFSAEGDRDREAFANVYVGLCYMWQGQPTEALIWIGHAVRESADYSTQYIGLLSLAVVNCTQGRWRSALDNLERLAGLVEAQECLSLIGRFYQHRAMAYRQGHADGEQGFLRLAIEDYETASNYFEQAGNRGFEGKVLNNLAYLYIESNPRLAHIHIDRAISLQKSVNDFIELAQAHDTEALIFLREGQLKKAKRSIDKAIATMRVNDHRLWLPNLLITRGRIYSQAKLVQLSKKDFAEAADIAEAAGDLPAAARAYLAAIESLVELVPVGDLIAMYRHANRLTPDGNTKAAMRVMDRVSEIFATSLPELAKTEHQQEAEIFRRAILDAKGSITKAATLVGLPRQTLAYNISTHHPELSSLLKPRRRRKKLLS
ncbi:MAG TPA: hypothetical protein VFX97_17015 [Pyrinomonadaceae bacterium]|nr:hypothetical protein [Pyrinomonadaceae bacterium]